jgi:hypothetical protein
MLEPPLFFFSQYRSNCAGIQQQMVINQKRWGPEVWEFCSSASQHT